MVLIELYLHPPISTSVPSFLCGKSQLQTLTKEFQTLRNIQSDPFWFIQRPPNVHHLLLARIERGKKLSSILLYVVPNKTLILKRKEKHKNNVGPQIVTSPWITCILVYTWQQSNIHFPLAVMEERAKSQVLFLNILVKTRFFMFSPYLCLGNFKKQSFFFFFFCLSKTNKKDEKIPNLKNLYKNYALAIQPKKGLKDKGLDSGMNFKFSFNVVSSLPCSHSNQLLSHSIFFAVMTREACFC